MEKHQKCDHTYGVGPEYDGSVRYYDGSNRGIDPGKDVEFDYCPWCGEKLEESEVKGDEEAE